MTYVSGTLAKIGASWNLVNLGAFLHFASSNSSCDLGFTGKSLGNSTATAWATLSEPRVQLAFPDPLGAAS